MFNRFPVLKPHSYSIRDFDMVILLAPVWAGKVAAPMRSFLLQEMDNIKKYSFITLCGGATGQNEKLTHELTTLLNMRPFRLTELWINDLLPQEKRNTIKYTSGYHVIPPDLSFFEAKIEKFIEAHRQPIGIS